jgi:hypothetical protein
MKRIESHILQRRFDGKAESGGADFSNCLYYRYRLWRRWSLQKGPVILWLMLNPSTADEKYNDPTIRRCVNYSKQWGFIGMDICNLFAWRATYPYDLYTAADPVGPYNDSILKQQIRCAYQIMVAWGIHGSYRRRDESIIDLLGDLQKPAYCLGITKSGAPKHPLRLKKSLLPVSFII